MERRAIIKVHYKEIRCINVKHDDRNSMDKNGNILPGAFTDDEVLPGRVQFFRLWLG